MAKATYLLRKASELVREKRYQDAVEVYLRATETAPSDSRAWFGLGVCLFRVGNLDVSRIALDRARHMGYPRADEALARVEAAERRRQAEGLGAKATLEPAEAEKRAAQRPSVTREPPPRPSVRPDDQKIELVRPLRVMLVESIEKDRHIMKRSIEGTIRDVEVVSVPFGVSTSETMSGSVHYDAAVLNWDSSPDAAAGLIQILKIKRPTLFVICLTEEWDPETAIEILEAGADYHLIKGAHFASTLPLLLAQWSDRDYAVAEDARRPDEGVSDEAANALHCLGEALIVVNSDYQIALVSRAALSAFGKSEEQLAGRSYAEEFYGSDVPPDSCPITRVLEEGEPCSGEMRPESPDKVFAIEAWPVHSQAGDLTGAVAVIREPAAPEAAAESDAEVYRAVIEHAGAGIAMVDPEGTFSYVNPGLCTMLGRDRDDLLGQPVSAIVSAEGYESLSECLDAANGEGQAATRITVERGDGTTVAVEARVALLGEDRAAALVMVLMDVSELERAEQELWGEASRSAGILDEGVDRLRCGVVVLDEDGAVTWLNSTAADLLGGDRNSLSGRPYLELVRESLEPRLEDGAAFLQALADGHQAGASLEDHALRLAAEGDGLAYWSTPIADGPAFAARVEHFYRVAPAAVSPMPAAEVRSEPMARIAGAVSDMVFTADPDARITWCNPAATAFVGYGQDRLIGMPLASLTPDDERWRLEDMLATALNEGIPVQRQEVPIVRADGRRLWAELTVLPRRPDDASPVEALEGVLHDITDRKMTEAIRGILAGEEAAAPEIEDLPLEDEDWRDM